MRWILYAGLLVAMSAAAQTDPWATLRSLEGNWGGAIWGKPGKGTSTREFRLELSGHFLSQRTQCVFESKSADAKPAVHEDFSILSYDANQKKIVWIQFHSEGFVNEYRLESASPDGKTFEFVTVRIENLPQGWRARKSYRVLSGDEIEETFSLAPPGKDFDPYTVAHIRRVK